MSVMTAQDKTRAKAFMHDILVSAGLTSMKRTSMNVWAGGGPDYHGVDKACIAISDEITDNKFNNIDAAIKEVCRLHFIGDIKESRRGYNYIKIDELRADDYIAYFCAMNNFFWDISTFTAEELRMGKLGEFMKSNFGTALAKFGCFTTSPDIDIDSVEVSGTVTDDSTAKDPATPSSSTGTAPSTPRSVPADKTDADGTKHAKWYVGAATKEKGKKKTTGPAKDDYKSSGSQFDNCRDIKSKRGEKEVDPTDWLFLIQGKNDRAEVDPANVHIKPLLSAPNAWKNEVSGTNKVFFSSGNAYRDAVLYWKTKDEALEFLRKLISAGRIPSAYTDVQVMTRQAKKCGGKPTYRGFYRVGTEFGEALIPAHKLNEMLEHMDEDYDETLDPDYQEFVPIDYRKVMDDGLIEDLEMYEKYINAD